MASAGHTPMQATKVAKAPANKMSGIRSRAALRGPKPSMSLRLKNSSVLDLNLYKHTYHKIIQCYIV